MKIHLATDHAGFKMKEDIKLYLKKLDYEVVDHGAFSYNPEDDYPEFIKLAAQSVSDNPFDKAIIFGGSGQGEDMVAGKYTNIRSAVYYGGPLEIVRLAKEHNNANILSLGARFMSHEEAQEAVQIFLETEFSGEERHIRRIENIEHE
ncbi:MAG: ribose 5-phosphate isomerase B [Flavobacteriaceae bacterium]|jgi:ribose 5-phosphate isomerase B